MSRKVSEKQLLDSYKIMDKMTNNINDILSNNFKDLIELNKDIFTFFIVHQGIHHLFIYHDIIDDEFVIKTYQISTDKIFDLMTKNQINIDTLKSIKNKHEVKLSFLTFDSLIKLIKMIHTQLKQ